jgi:hypothetical protein
VAQVVLVEQIALHLVLVAQADRQVHYLVLVDRVDLKDLKDPQAQFQDQADLVVRLA